MLEGLGRVTAFELNKDAENIGLALNDTLKSAQANGEAVVVVGWSLGGLLAIGHLSQVHLAQFSGCLKGLVLIGCNPKFVGDASWPGVSKTVFADFTELLAQSPDKLLQRFNRLQMLGATEAKALARASDGWRRQSQAWGYTQLQRSLCWLSDRDMRPQLAALRIPVLHLLGANDALVPSKQLAEALSQTLPHQMTRVVDGMPHYPAANYSAQISALMTEFLHDE